MELKLDARFDDPMDIGEESRRLIGGDTEESPAGSMHTWSRGARLTTRYLCNR